MEGNRNQAGAHLPPSSACVNVGQVESRKAVPGPRQPQARSVGNAASRSWPGGSRGGGVLGGQGVRRDTPWQRGRGCQRYSASHRHSVRFPLSACHPLGHPGSALLLEGTAPEKQEPAGLARSPTNAAPTPQTAVQRCFPSCTPFPSHFLQQRRHVPAGEPLTQGRSPASSATTHSEHFPFPVGGSLKTALGWAGRPGLAPVSFQEPPHDPSTPLTQGHPVGSVPEPAHHGEGQTLPAGLPLPQSGLC